MSGHNTLATAIFVLLAAAPVAAQGVSQDLATSTGSSLLVSLAIEAPAAPLSTPSALGPTTLSGVAGVRVDASTSVYAPAAVAVQSRSNNPAMMIVGGAAMIVGAVIGGDAGTIVMVVGGVIGLVGLWNFLQ